MSETNHTYLQIHPADNVLVALTDLAQGSVIQFNDLQFFLAHDVAPKHKFTINELAPGDHIIMYGVLVGKALTQIPQGGPITVDNIVHASDSYSLHNRNTSWHQPDISHFKRRPLWATTVQMAR